MLRADLARVARAQSESELETGKECPGTPLAATSHLAPVGVLPLLENTKMVGAQARSTSNSPGGTRARLVLVEEGPCAALPSRFEGDGIAVVVMSGLAGKPDAVVRRIELCTKELAAAVESISGVTYLMGRAVDERARADRLAALRAVARGLPRQLDLVLQLPDAPSAQTQSAAFELAGEFLAECGARANVRISLSSADSAPGQWRLRSTPRADSAHLERRHAS